MLDSFHIEMAFFKVLGKLVDSSGGPEMLKDNDVLASGSLSSFLKFKSMQAFVPYLGIGI